MSKVFLSIGSNKGNRFKNIKRSINLIDTESDIEIIKKSKIYETQPMYNLNQDYFLNMVILIKTNLNPEKLLQLTQKVERTIGRINLNQKKNLPREIDIDILTYSNKAVITKDLVIPHPKINERAFVLKPWTDIDPDYKLFNMEQSISELLSNIIVNSKTIKNYKKL